MLLVVDSKGRVRRLYNIWKNQRQRCSNPNASGYSSYGAKGIKQCEEWNDFFKFQEWALRNGYEEHLECDRIDSEGDYSPANCRWVTKSYNSAQRNKENGHLNKSKLTVTDQRLAFKLKGEGWTYKAIGDYFGIGISHAKRLVDNEIKNLLEEECE